MRHKYGGIVLVFALGASAGCSSAASSAVSPSTSSGSGGSAISPPAKSPGQSGTYPSLDSALTKAIAKQRAPGAQAAIYSCGNLIWSASAGVLDTSSKRPVADDSRFVLASATKVYTGTMIMDLIQQGKLSLDTPVSKYYPNVPNASSITVEMLLRMSSGLPDYESDPAIENALNDPRHVWTREEVINSLHAALFAPGTQYRYTNSNFVILGGIIEDVTGAPIEQDFEQMIATPANLTESSFTSPARDSDLFAHPYSTQDNGTITDGWVPGFGIGTDTIGPIWTDGGLASTARDVAKFEDALFAGKIISPQTVVEMSNVDQNQEGLGVESSDFDGYTWLGHSGTYGGFESELWYDKTRGLTIAVTTNRDESGSAGNTTSGNIWNAVASAFDSVSPDPHSCG